MVATPSGAGYLLVGSDGGVFSFGQSHFYGSLPGIHKNVHDIRAILPSSAGTGYILVGADGGAFIFGSGVRFYGSLPGEGIRVANIVGIALTPDNGGYYMAGSDGHVYTFGDAQAAPQPAGLTSNLPVAAIAGT
jgi:ribosomal protein L24E